ncbi:MAG: hypothetical protein F4213_22250 [Boseongicola sp. SB0677_bin_26]|nr:hypothetical protein [Boseongicola sp. SB0665_bin_10]MYG28702.1 hypothetical protein [Boseongicola sp. SB0677_bin_26]
MQGRRHERHERTPGGHCRVRVPVGPDAILHARVSGAKQESSLDARERLLRDRHPDGHVVREAGSGVDFRRRGPVALLERAMRGEAVHVVAAAPDRITRSGSPTVGHVIELSGGSIELLEAGDHSVRSGVRRLAADLASSRDFRHGKRPGQGHEEDQGLPEGP